MQDNRISSRFYMDLMKPANIIFIFFTGLHYRNPYPRAVSYHSSVQPLFQLFCNILCSLNNFISLFYFVLSLPPVDLLTTTGTGDSEGQEAASTAAPEEAGQANLLTVT